MIDNIDVGDEFVTKFENLVNVECVNRATEKKGLMIKVNQTEDIVM